MSGSVDPNIFQRIAQVRHEVAGPRGKSHFASRLGISASTYNYYERNRVPPAEVLLKIADLGGVDVRWLLTGEPAKGPQVLPGHPILQRVAGLLRRNPNAATTLAAFLDVLGATQEFPADSTGAPAADAPAKQTRQSARRGWIPILGRTAAGVPQFWAGDEAGRVKSLAELVARRSRRAPTEVRSARIEGQQGDVQIITLSEAQDEDVAEFLSAPQIIARHADAFAVRADGESMAPDIRHGDVVVLSPSAPAADGHPAVVQLRDQIGVTCKLYRRQGAMVHLVPINEQFPPQSFPQEQIVWALRVLARIRG